MTWISDETNISDRNITRIKAEEGSEDWGGGLGRHELVVKMYF